MQKFHMRMSIILFYALLANAQAPPAKAPVGQPPRDPLGRSTPRGTFVTFLTLCEKQDYPRAVQLLDTRLGEKSSEQLAVQLQSVLNHRLAVNLQKLSDAPEGDTGDGLPPDKELIGVVRWSKGTAEILLTRSERNHVEVWLFAPETLSLIPEIYEEIRPSPLEPYLPQPLVTHTWLGIALWKWIALLAGLFFAGLLSRLVRKFVVPLIGPVTGRLTQYQDESLVESLVGPLQGLIVLAFIQYTVSVISLPLLARLVWSAIRSKLIILLAAWLFMRLVRIFSELARRRMESGGRTDTTAVVLLFQRTINALAVFVAVALLLYSAGYNVTAMLAGLGVGGIAIALAAQKTLENLFGGISVIFDKPIRVGDTCSIGDRVGVVEDIGLRSTRMRTQERTVLTIPNGQLSSMTLENFALRDKIWLNHVFSLRPETTAAQLQQVVSGLRKQLADHEMIETETARANFTKCGASSLNIEIFAYVLTPSYERFLEIQEAFLLQALALIEATGAETALPSQLLYLARAKGGSPGSTTGETDSPTS